MTDYQPIDYRLRCHTKRTDLPVDVMRDICEAYAYITDLQRRIQNLREGFEGSCTTCEPVGMMNQKLREEQEDTTKLVEITGAILAATADALHGGPLPDEGMHSWHDLPELVKKLRTERDEARRVLCRYEAHSLSQSPPQTANQVADRRGWDCFKENTND